MIAVEVTVDTLMPIPILIRVALTVPSLLTKHLVDKWVTLRLVWALDALPTQAFREVLTAE
jgi:hypothetical protein